MGDFYIETQEVDTALALESSPGVLLWEDGGRVLMEVPETIDVASDGIPPGQTFEGSRRCAQCGFLYKYHDLKYFRGRYYGIPCGDYKDIASILRREMAERQRSRIREQHRHR